MTSTDTSPLTITELAEHECRDRLRLTPFGRVVAQSIDAGKKVPYGSTIEIQVV